MPVQLTRGPLIFWNAAFSPDGRTLLANGGEQRGELMRLDSATHQTSHSRALWATEEES